MCLQVRQFIQLYSTCQKMSDNRFSIFTKPFSVATYLPMVRLNIDFVAPINTDDDSGYIPVIIDKFSKWVELYACKNATAKAAANCLVQRFGRYGAPSQILSDNGSHFVNEFITEILVFSGTEHVLTVAYSKKENAMNERVNIIGTYAITASTDV